MEKKGQIKIIVIVLLILIITSVLAIFISMKNRDNNENVIDNMVVENKEIKRLDNDIVFTLQDIINDYYETISQSNYEKLYNLLDEDYLKENNINKQNISTIIMDKYGDASFFVNKVLCNNDRIIRYYFINGYLLNFDTNIYEKNINFIVIVKNGKYVINPIGNNDIDIYSKNYSLINKNIKDTNSFKIKNISDKSKMITYIALFLNMLDVDSLKAYNMLDEKTKEKYGSYEIFLSLKNTIYNEITPTVFAYSVEKDENQIFYYLKDNKQKSIGIIEYYPMDFVINF